MYAASLMPSSAAEVNSIVLCTCFPMMPRFASLLSERYVHIKSYASRHTQKRSSVGDGDVRNVRKRRYDRAFNEDTTRLKHPSEHLFDIESGQRVQASQNYGNSNVDLELATFNHSEIELPKGTTL